MKDQIDNLIEEHRELLKQVDTNKNIAQIVKSIDNLTQEIYHKIYQYRIVKCLLIVHQVLLLSLLEF